MARFLVAGAGHGGLCAAMHLARAGGRVTVAERQPEAVLGHDWMDVFEFGVLERNGFRSLPESGKVQPWGNTLYGPSKRWPKLPPDDPITQEACFERREVLASMVADCREAGVDFAFETEVHGPLVLDNRVCGLLIREGGVQRELPGGMVIDASGGLSALREKMPEDILFPVRLAPTQLFHVWRGYLDRVPGADPQIPYKTILGHQGRKGISWVIAYRDSMDVLVGQVGEPLTQTDIDGALEDLREFEPLLGRKLLRGGFATIPLRRPLGMMVADGYAAVGDSACMADPFCGSGICSAIDQGKLLADVLLERCRGDFGVEKLWSYQYRTFTEKPPALVGFGTKDAKERAASEMLTSAVLTLRPKQVDVMFRRGIISIDNIDGPKVAMALLGRNLDHLPLLLKLAGAAAKGGKLGAMIENIPRGYEPQAVAEWVRAYEGFNK